MCNPRPHQRKSAAERRRRSGHVVLSRLYFRPRLLDTLKGYTRKDFFHDLGAGVTVGVVALPLAMAFAIASGVKPEQGIFTAIVAGFLISAFGGSNVLFIWPRLLRHFSPQYRTVLLGTFLLTVIFDLTVAVEVGLLLACVFFIYRMCTLFRVEPHDVLAQLHRALERQGVRMLLCDLNEQPRSLITRSGFEAVMGADNICADLNSAIEAVIQVQGR